MTANKPPFAYRVRFALLTPIVIAYTIWRGLKERSKRYILQRLGFFYPRLSNPIWIHCASVGEFNTALPLIVQLQKHFPETAFLVTTNTTTSAAVFEQRHLPGVTHSYLPLDTHFAVARFLSNVTPCAAVVMETELWPALFSAIGNADIPLIIANARLSQRTLRVEKPWLLQAYQRCLMTTQRVLARNETDGIGYQRLGADPTKIEVIGNLKFAPPQNTCAATEKIVTRPYVLAASTHYDEEVRIADAWKATRKNTLSGNSELLVIVPRHPQRGSDITKQLRDRGWQIARRSNKDKITEGTDIYLADTIGEVQNLIAHARWVFMGGSLIPHGGQNILEAARANKAIVCGPFMDNFIDETEALLHFNGLIKLEETHQLQDAIVQLQDDDACKKLGDNAYAACHKHQDVAIRYATAIVEIINRESID